MWTSLKRMLNIGGADIFIQTEHEYYSQGENVCGTLVIPSAIDPSGCVMLRVVPSNESRAVIKTCEKLLKFSENRSYRTWSSSNQATTFRLVPPPVLKGELDYLELNLWQRDDGGVAGELIFDLQEKSIGDYFKAIFNYDQVSQRLHLSHEQLFAENGGINTDEISRVIGEKLKDVLVERGSK